MKKIYSIAALALTLAFASCSNLMEKDIAPESRGAVQFTTNIGAFATRVTADGFENGDQVGIMADSPINVDNVLYTFSGNTLSSTTPIHWLEGQTEETYFFAYYPYDKDLSMYTDYAYVINVATDQRSHEAYSRSDFLVASAEARPGETVNLEFEHYMSRVDIALPASLAASVSSVALSGVCVSMKYGEAFNEATVTAAEITDATGEKAWSAIIVPQTCNPSLEITKTDGSVLSYSLNKKTSFESGKRYKARLSLKEDGSLEAEFVFSIFDWLYGDWVWFDGYTPRWGVIGNFTNWEWDYQMERTATGVYSIDLYLPEEAEFKFRLDGSWDTDFGCAWYENETEFRSTVELGQTIKLMQGGPNLYYPKGGRVKIELNVNECTAVISEYKEYYLDLVTYAEDGSPKWMDYRFDDASDGLFTLSELYLPAGGVFRLKDAVDWSTYGAAEADGTDGRKILTAGEAIKLTQSGSSIYVTESMFADFVFDPNELTLTVSASENQEFDIDRLLGLDNGTAVTMTSQTVYAVAEEGFVVSRDGQRGLFIYTGYGNPLPGVGDVVDVAGTKNLYYDQLELKDASFVKTGTASVEGVEYGSFDGYAPEALPIIVTGTLLVRPYTSHEVVYIDTGDGVFKTHYCFDEYLKYYGSTVEVLGWGGGNRWNDNLAITVVSINGLEELPHGSGTVEDPFDPVGAVLYTRSLTPGSTGTEDIAVKGRVLSVTRQYTDTGDYAGYGSFLLSDNGNSSYECYFNIQLAAFLENKAWVEGNSLIQQGDEVTVVGRSYLWDDGLSTQMAESRSYIHTLNGITEETPVPFQYSGDGSLENPYSVADAIHVAEKTGETPTDDFYYIRGRISNVISEFSSYYGNATFYMTDEDGDGREFQAYRIYYFDNQKWTDGQYNISLGDDVTVYARIVNYRSYLPETQSGSAWLYSLNGITEPYAKMEGNWSIIGDIQGHSWNYDIPMYKCYNGDGYYALVYYRDGDSFKIRLNADWAVNFGISGGGGIGGWHGESGGDNICLPEEGFYEILFYPEDGNYIYIAPFGKNDTWGITGSLEGLGWESDHMGYEASVNDMLSPVVIFRNVVCNEGEEFKIRFQHDWVLEFGYDADWTGESYVLAPDVYYPLRAAGPNMSISESGTYDIYFDLYGLTIRVVKTEGAGQPELQSISIPEIVELVKGGTSSSPVSFEGIIDYSVVTYTNGNYAYLQDNSGSILLYKWNHGLNAGDIFHGHISGSGYLYHGLPEITDIGSDYTLDGNYGQVNPDETTLEDVYEYYDFYMSRLIRLTDVTVVSVSGRNATISQDGKEITLRTQKTGMTLPTEGSIGNLTAIVSYYDNGDNGCQLSFWEEDWFEKTGEIEPEEPEETGIFAAASLSDLSAGDVIVLVSTKDSTSVAMSNSNGTSAAPSAISIEPAGDGLLENPDASLVWYVDVTDDGLVFYKNEERSEWLYCTSSNNGVRVGTDSNNLFTVDADSGYLVNAATSRYLGVYNSQDWRCYTTINNNIKDQVFSVYIKVSNQ